MLVVRLIVESGGPISRDELAAWLWPMADEKHAKLALRQLLASAKRWADPIGLCLFHASPSAVWRTDACERTDLDDLLSAEPGSVLPYPGRMLGDFLPESRAAQDWLDQERERVTDRFRDLAVTAAELGRIDGVAKMLAAAARLRPYDEAIVRARMTMEASTGNVAEVPRLLAAFAERVGNDLGEGVEDLGFSAQDPAGYGKQPSPLPRVLILPPVADSRLNSEQKAVAQGFVDDITLGLCRERTFRVFAPYTARTSWAADVRADYIVKSRLSPGSPARFGALVIHVASGRVVSANEVSFAFDRLWRSHTDISQSVAAAIGQAIARNELRGVDGAPLASAYVEYLRGSQHLEMHHLASIRRAAVHFKRALVSVPDFVPAMTQLARSRTYEWLQFMDKSDTRSLREAERLAERAVHLEPLDEKGHRELGLVALYNWRLDEALEHYARAESLAPHHADLIADRADVMAHASEWVDAEEAIRRALELNPAAPDEYLWTQGAIYFFTTRYELAVATLEQMKNRDLALALTAASAAMAGDMPKARAYARRTKAVIPSFDPDNVVRVAPQRDPADIEHYVSALRLAGL